MKLIEKIDAEYDKADSLSGRCDIRRDTLLGWKNEAEALEAELVSHRDGIAYKTLFALAGELKDEKDALNSALDVAMNENQRLTKIVEDYETSREE